jgi:hypothetical protein
MWKLAIVMLINSTTPPVIIRMPDREYSDVTSCRAAREAVVAENVKDALITWAAVCVPAP